MPDYVAGIMKLLKDGPQPTPDDAQIAAWLEAKRATYPPNTPPERSLQWQDYDRGRYKRHFADRATHAAAAEAVTRSKTMLIGLLGLSAQANKVAPPERPMNRQDLGVQPWPTSSIK